MVETTLPPFRSVSILNRGKDIFSGTSLGAIVKFLAEHDAFNFSLEATDADT